MKVITVHDTPPYGHAPTYQLSLTYPERQKCYGPHKKILFKKQLFVLRSKVKVPRRSLWYATHRLMVMHIRTIFQWSFVGFICIIWPWGQRSRSHKGHYGMRHTALWSCIYELSVHEQLCWIYLNYLTLRSKVKVPWRSLQYATHCLMVIHPHTNYHWPIS